MSTKYGKTSEMKEFTSTFKMIRPSLCDKLLTKMLHKINKFNEYTASWLRSHLKLSPA
jgi:hypothetical protein